MVSYSFRNLNPNESDQDLLKIDSVSVFWVEDDSQPDFLGAFSNEPKRGAIDRESLGEWRPNEYRYFNPTNYDPEHPEYAMEDYRRYQRFCDGDWSLEGCVARAVVSYPVGEGVRRIEVLSSAGIYGIESDSDPIYKLETEIEQLANLEQHVQVFGISWSAKEESIVAGAIERLAQLQKKSAVGRPA